MNDYHTIMLYHVHEIDCLLLRNGIVAKISTNHVFLRLGVNASGFNNGGQYAMIARKV